MSDYSALALLGRTSRGAKFGRGLGRLGPRGSVKSGKVYKHDRHTKRMPRPAEDKPGKRCSPVPVRAR
jgi:hypothetical protein